MDDNRWLWRVGWLAVLALILFLIWWLWPPTANPDGAVLDPAARTRTIDVLANDTDLFHRSFFIKDWTNGGGGGTVVLAPNGHELIYARPKDGGVLSDSFTYSIWTRHGFPSSASVTIALSTRQVAAPASPAGRRTGPLTTQTLVAILIDDCPRGEKHTAIQTTPLPKRYGNCVVVYFPWHNAKVFAEHAKAVKAMLREIAKESSGRALEINGYTDTSGVHYASLSKERACSALKGLRLAGFKGAIYTFADGTKNPEATTAPEVEERLNRRVDITFGDSAFSNRPDAVQCLN